MMNNKKLVFYPVAVLIGFLMLVSSCKNDFEDEPLNNITEDYVWDKTDVTGSYAERFLAKAYTYLPQGYARINGVPLDCITDDAVPSDSRNTSWNFITGGYNQYNLLDDNWASMYRGIRVVNSFLNNYQRVPWADPNRPKWFAAEARVLRAMFYYELIKRYGGIPLIGDRVFEANDEELYTIKRNTFEESVNYVVAELEAVKDDLRPDASLVSRDGKGTKEGTDPDAGRMRKSGALAIKAKILLLAASPLFNSPEGNSNPLSGYTSYDAERWNDAAKAAKDVIDLNLFKLEPSRWTLAMYRVNTENILFRQGGGNTNQYGYRMSPVGYRVNNVDCNGLVSPTQELVDAFPMVNGKGIYDDQSGYVSNNPYAGRDPRLNQTIFYNGSRWLKRDVATYEGGADKPNVVSKPVQTQTGYYAKKFLANDAENAAFTATPYQTEYSFWVYVRYADILLSYAEALNEYSGPLPAVSEAVDLVRTRAGIGTIAQAFGTVDQTKMQEIIRNERRVEFAFEEHRFWDLRRWKIAETKYGNGAVLHGVKITRADDGTLSYSKVPVATPFFFPGMYRLPVANREILVNPNMKQNDGY